MSVALSGECLMNCPVVPASTPPTTISVPGWHYVGGTCMVDVPQPVPFENNNTCSPDVVGKTVNKVN